MKLKHDQPSNISSQPRPEPSADPYFSWPWVERRRGIDRRGSPTPLLSRFLFRGNRAVGRREGESQNSYFDRIPRNDVALGLAILVLNLLDALFTLVIVGADLEKEANPMARWLLEAGTGWFIFSKAVVVALCILFLALHRAFRFVRPALWALCAFYTALLGYHLYLLSLR
jgi:hypothetical protein